MEVFNNLSLFGWPVKGQALRRTAQLLAKTFFSLKGVEPWTHEGKLESFQGAVSIQCFEAVFKPIWRRYIFVFMAVYGYVFT